MIVKWMKTLLEKIEIKESWPNKIYDVNGIDIYWMDYDRRRICGHSYRPKVGEGFRAKMQSGKYGIFLITKVDWCGDPRNMYFATVKDMGYENERN